MSICHRLVMKRHSRLRTRSRWSSFVIIRRKDLSCKDLSIYLTVPPLYTRSEGRMSCHISGPLYERNNELDQFEDFKNFRTEIQDKTAMMTWLCRWPKNDERGWLWRWTAFKDLTSVIFNKFANDLKGSADGHQLAYLKSRLTTTTTFLNMLLWSS